MMKVRLLSGPFAGQERIVPDDVEPIEVLVSCVRNNWDWELDYSKATPPEAIKWGSYALIARCFKAVSKGRTVFFQGKEYRSTQDVLELGEDIAALGWSKGVTLKEGGPKRVVIEVVDLEDYLLDS